VKRLNLRWGCWGREGKIAMKEETEAKRERKLCDVEVDSVQED
jgi:hypothetical protein